MPFAGYLVYRGELGLIGVALAGAAGCVLGSLVAYAVGARGGRPAIERWGRFVLLGHRALGPGDGLLGASPPRRAHLHRAPGGDRADGALALRVAHLRGLAPLVLGARLRGLHAGGELERGAREDARLRHGGLGARPPRVGVGARTPPARPAQRTVPASARALARAASASHEGEARTSSSADRRTRAHRSAAEGDRTFLLEPERRFRETRSHANAPSR